MKITLAARAEKCTKLLKPVVHLKVAMTLYVNYTRVKEVTQTEAESKSHLHDPCESIGTAKRQAGVPHSGTAQAETYT